MVGVASPRLALMRDWRSDRWRISLTTRRRAVMLAALVAAPTVAVFGSGRTASVSADAGTAAAAGRAPMHTQVKGRC